MASPCPIPSFVWELQAKGVSELQQQVVGVVERLREAEEEQKLQAAAAAVKPVFQQDQEAVGVVLCRSLPFCLGWCYGVKGESGQKSGGDVEVAICQARPSDNISKNVMSETDNEFPATASFDVMTIGGY